MRGLQPICSYLSHRVLHGIVYRSHGLRILGLTAASHWLSNFLFQPLVFMHLPLWETSWTSGCPLSSLYLLPRKVEFPPCGWYPLLACGSVQPWVSVSKWTAPRCLGSAFEKRIIEWSRSWRSLICFSKSRNFRPTLSPVCTLASCI